MVQKCPPLPPPKKISGRKTYKSLKSERDVYFKNKYLVLMTSFQYVFMPLGTQKTEKVPIL